MDKNEKIISEGIECYRISDKAFDLIGKIATSQYSNPEFDIKDEFENSCDIEIYFIKKFLLDIGVKINFINIEACSYCGWDFFVFAAITTDHGLYFYKSYYAYHEDGDILDIKKVDLPSDVTVIQACEKVLSEIVTSQNYYMKEYIL